MNVKSLFKELTSKYKTNAWLDKKIAELSKTIDKGIKKELENRHVIYEDLNNYICGFNVVDNPLEIVNKMIKNKHKNAEIIKILTKSKNDNINTFKTDIKEVNKKIRVINSQLNRKRINEPKEINKKQSLLNQLNEYNQEIEKINGKINKQKDDIEKIKDKIIDYTKEIKKSYKSLEKYNNDRLTVEDYFEDRIFNLLDEKMSKLRMDPKSVVEFVKNEFKHVPDAVFLKLCLKYYLKNLNHLIIIMAINVEYDENDPDKIISASKYITLNQNNAEEAIKMIDDYFMDNHEIVSDSFGAIASLAIKQIVNIVFMGVEAFENMEKRKQEKAEYLEAKKIKLLEKESAKKDIKIKKLEKQISKQKTKRKGGFFNYLNKTNIDLTRYGIYTDFNEENYNLKCLTYALEMGGMDKTKINMLHYQSQYEPEKTPANKLNIICDLLQIKILLKDDKDPHLRVYGKDYDETYNIGLLYEHYFINEDIKITSYAINNYEKLKDAKDFYKIVGINSKGSYKRDETRFITSYDAIKLMMENNLFEPIPENILIGTRFNNIDQFDEVNFVENDGKTFKLVKYDDNYDITNEDDEQDRIIFDIETYTELKIITLHHKNDDETDEEMEDDYTQELKIHVPYIICYYNLLTKEKGGYVGLNCVMLFLNSLQKNTTLYAHNAKYDYSFLMKHLNNHLEYKRDGRLIMSKSHFNGLTIIINDTLSKIPMQLSEFSNSFNLNGLIKEIMPYKLYSEPNAINKRFYSINYVLEKYIKPYEREQFLLNIEKWNLSKDGETYDIIEYSKNYCLIDCEITAQGYLTFKKWMEDLTKINVDKCLTITSISKNYLIKEGCYENCYKISGIPRNFIQKCVDGGRCMTLNNERYHIDEPMGLIDARGLYPSAIDRLCEDKGGFLCGIPKIITDLDYDNIKNYDGYFVKIKILKVGIKRGMPLLYTNDKGIKKFTNKMIGKHIYVDKIKLEDLIKFHDIEFEIIKGYYFDEGRNNNAGKIFKKLFNERSLLQKNDNRAEIVYKLLMNSGYGFNLMKENEKEVKFVNDVEGLRPYIEKGYTIIPIYGKYNKYKVESMGASPYKIHYNMCHIGNEILSMSKRIMNEIICLAEDNDIKIYYQDTDSLHILMKDIEKLETLYLEKYNKILRGEEMGNFQNDFKLKYYKDDDGKILIDEKNYVLDNEKEFKFKGYKSYKCKNLSAIESIILTKKIYLDVLKGYDENNNIVYGYYYRMKGIPDSCIRYTANKLNISIRDLYLLMYCGANIEFDLTEGGEKDCFEFNKNYDIYTKKKFSRDIIIEEVINDDYFC